MLLGEQKPYEEGSILMDAPEHNTMAELAELAQDRDSWQVIKHAIGTNEQWSKPPQSQARRMLTRSAARRTDS